MPENTTWNAGSLLTISTTGEWKLASSPITDNPIGIVHNISDDGNAAVIRFTGSDLLYRTEPSRHILPITNPTKKNIIKPRKKQEKIKTITDQMKDIP